MIEAISYLRKTLYSISSYQICGFQIDTGLHFIVGFIMFTVLRRFIGVKRSLYISFGLIVLKEIADLFFKSRIEYIRAPHLDMLYDLLFGTIGVLLAYYWDARRKRTKTDN